MILEEKLDGPGGTGVLSAGNYGESGRRGRLPVWPELLQYR